MEKEPFGVLCGRFFEGLKAAVEAATGTSRLDRENSPLPFAPGSADADDDRA